MTPANSLDSSGVTPAPAGVVAVVATGSDTAQARSLAQTLGVEVVSALPDHGLVLQLADNRLQLRDAGQPATRALFVDFNSDDIKRRLRAGMRGNFARALGLHRRPQQSVFDATCGLARDSAVLLGLGCSVLACERQPVLQLLLRDGIERAGRLQGWRGLIERDAATWLNGQSEPVAEIIYIDPMFGGGRDALPKWDMQALHAIADDDQDAANLLGAARPRASRRVVVKRHPRGEVLAAPDRQLRGKRTRFDIYLTTEKDSR